MTRTEFRKKYDKRFYMGDGLYAHFDGFSFMLFAERENGEHWVGLEPNVFDELIEFRKQVYKDAENFESEKE